MNNEQQYHTQNSKMKTRNFELNVKHRVLYTSTVKVLFPAYLFHWEAEL